MCTRNVRFMSLHLLRFVFISPFLLLVLTDACVFQKQRNRSETKYSCLVVGSFAMVVLPSNAQKCTIQSQLLFGFLRAP